MFLSMLFSSVPKSKQENVMKQRISFHVANIDVFLHFWKTVVYWKINED